jgi:hypothetical protein
MSLRNIIAAGAFGIVASSAAYADSFSESDFSSMSGMTLAGSAAQVNSSQLALTSNTVMTAGAAYESNQFALGTGGSFSTSFQFEIDPSADGSGTNANGFAFVLTSNASGLGGANANLGLTAANSLAIEFRTFNNSTTGPAGNNNLVGVVQNGNTAFNSLLGSGTPYGQGTCDRLHYTQAGCMSNGDLWTANISYAAGLLTVALTDGNQTQTTTIAGLSLSLLSLLGSGDVYAGFSASTGGKTERVRLMNWTMNSDSPVPEPLTLSMFGTGLVALGLVRRRRAAV